MIFRADRMLFFDINRISTSIKLYFKRSTRYSLFSTIIFADNCHLFYIFIVHVYRYNWSQHNRSNWAIKLEESWAWPGYNLNFLRNTSFLPIKMNISILSLTSRMHCLLQKKSSVLFYNFRNNWNIN